MHGHAHTDGQTDRVTTEGTLSGFQDFFLQPIIKDLPNNTDIQTQINKVKVQDFSMGIFVVQHTLGCVDVTHISFMYTPRCKYWYVTDMLQQTRFVTSRFAKNMVCRQTICDCTCPRSRLGSKMSGMSHLRSTMALTRHFRSQPRSRTSGITA